MGDSKSLEADLAAFRARRAVEEQAKQAQQKRRAHEVGLTAHLEDRREAAVGVQSKVRAELLQSPALLESQRQQLRALAGLEGKQEKFVVGRWEGDRMKIIPAVDGREEAVAEYSSALAEVDLETGIGKPIMLTPDDFISTQPEPEPETVTAKRPPRAKRADH